MIPLDQELESYVPVYDVAPKTWEEGRGFVVEQFKRMANAINVREIGFFIDQQVLAGKFFLPSTGGSQPQQFRSILRMVVVFPGLSIGVNTQPHGILIDASFSLIQLFGAATDSIAFTGEPLPNGADTITYDATDIIITVAAAYDRAWAVIEYIQEL